MTETIKIQKKDVDLDAGIIKLSETKNSKQRYVVMSDSLIELMRAFADKTFYALLMMTIYSPLYTARIFLLQQLRQYITIFFGMQAYRIEVVDDTENECMIGATLCRKVF